VRGLTDEERAILQHAVTNRSMDDVSVATVERLAAQGRIRITAYSCCCSAFSEVHMHATTTPDSKLALELDTLARRCWE